jgi:large subunit ribosomal protein L29
MANKLSRELAELSDTELVERLATEKDRLFKMRFQRVTGQMENHAGITAAKRDVARILTELRAREIAAAESLPAGEGSKR